MTRCKYIPVSSALASCVALPSASMQSSVSASLGNCSMHYSTACIRAVVPPTAMSTAPPSFYAGC